MNVGTGVSSRSPLGSGLILRNRDGITKNEREDIFAGNNLSFWQRGENVLVMKSKKIPSFFPAPTRTVSK